MSEAERNEVSRLQGELVRVSEDRTLGHDERLTATLAAIWKLYEAELRLQASRLTEVEQ